MGSKYDAMAAYGSVIVPRVKCPLCGEMSLCSDGKTLCCEAGVPIERIKKHKRMTEAMDCRRSASRREKDKILDEQDWRCYYCGNLFGKTVKRRGKSVTLQVHFDHSVPYAYSGNNANYNFVAACHVCNLIKSSKVFSTREEAIEYIQTRCIEKGYENMW